MQTSGAQLEVLFAAFDEQTRALIEMTHVNDFLGTCNTIHAEAAVFA